MPQNDMEDTKELNPAPVDEVEVPVLVSQAKAMELWIVRNRPETITGGSVIEVAQRTLDGDKNAIKTLTATLAEIGRLAAASEEMARNADIKEGFANSFGTIARIAQEAIDGE